MLIVPLSTRATNVMRDYTDDYNADFLHYMQRDPETLFFPATSNS
jgi:hypothetical protein